MERKSDPDLHKSENGDQDPDPDLGKLDPDPKSSESWIRTVKSCRGSKWSDGGQ